MPMNLRTRDEVIALLPELLQPTWWVTKTPWTSWCYVVLRGDRVYGPDEPQGGSRLCDWPEQSSWVRCPPPQDILPPQFVTSLEDFVCGPLGEPFDKL